MSLQVQILTSSQTLLKGEADQVVAPSEKGEVGILPNHTDYLTTLKQGTIRVEQQNGSREFNISGGLLRVAGNQVTLLVDQVMTVSA